MEPTSEPSEVVKASDKVSLPIRMGWGAGGLADNYIMNTFLVLAMPIYNIALGMDAMLLGAATLVPRVLDAFSDLFMGNISDNTRSRWGRRRPYIVAGTILSIILLPLLWLPPFRTGFGMFWYVLILGTIYLTAYTVYVVPYTALGYELTTDYNERTRVLAWRMYIGLIGSMTVPWFYWLCIKIYNLLSGVPEAVEGGLRQGVFWEKILPVFGTDMASAACWLSIGLGGVIFLTGVLPALVCREKGQAQMQEKINILSALRCTLKNRPFIILCIAYVIIIAGLFSAGTLGLYVNIYYVCNSQELAAKISGLVGTLSALTAYVSLFLIKWVSVRWDKRSAMITGLGFTLAGVCLSWFTLIPGRPYLQLISAFVFSLGLQGCWLMVSSMVADICDEDELQTGLRREGIYSAVNGLVLKIALSVTLVAGGTLLNLAGYDPVLAENEGTVALNVALRMKTLMIGSQAAALIFAIVIFLFYPITRQRAEETRRILDARRAAQLQEHPQQ